MWSKTQDDVLWKDLNWQPTGAVRPDGRLVFAKFDPNINDAVLLTNTKAGDIQTIAFKVEKPYRHGFYASGSYLYSQAQTVSDGGAFVRAQLVARPICELRREQPDRSRRRSIQAGNRCC